MSQSEPFSSSDFTPHSAAVIGPRHIGAVNWLGLQTLYVKEVQRFLKVYLQTIAAPVVTTLMFMAIFALALGGGDRQVAGVPFMTFLAPGLVMMAITQNAFANTASSILISKIQGNIVDLLMPPLSAAELAFGMAMGGATRGVLVAVTLYIAMSPFADMSVEHWWAVIYFAVSAAVLLSLVGIAAGVWAEKFDHLATVTNFGIMPLSFLSGTFYSIDRLPGIWKTISNFNPFFYLIDGLRYGFIGRSDGSLTAGVLVTLGLNLFLWWLCYRLFAKGYKLKA